MFFESLRKQKRNWTDVLSLRNEDGSRKSKTHFIKNLGHLCVWNQFKRQNQVISQTRFENEEDMMNVLQFFNVKDLKREKKTKDRSQKHFSSKQTFKKSLSKMEVKTEKLIATDTKKGNSFPYLKMEMRNSFKTFQTEFVRKRRSFVAAKVQILREAVIKCSLFGNDFDIYTEKISFKKISLRNHNFLLRSYRLLIFFGWWYSFGKIRVLTSKTFKVMLTFGLKKQWSILYRYAWKTSKKFLCRQHADAEDFLTSSDVLKLFKRSFWKTSHIEEKFFSTKNGVGQKLSTGKELSFLGCIGSQIYETFFMQTEIHLILIKMNENWVFKSTRR